MDLTTLHYIEINIISIGMMLIVYTNLDKRHKKKSMLFDQFFFQSIILCCILALFADILMVSLDGTNYFLSRPILILSSIVYFLLHPIHCMLWLFYVENKLYQNKAQKHSLFFYMPTIVLVFMTLASPVTDWIFYFDSENVYHRGSFLTLVTPFSYAYVAYSIVITLKFIRSTKDDAGKTELYHYLIFFPILPIFGGILQMMFYGTSLIFPCTALALLIQYINVQNRQISLDSLTGLFNRRQIERFYNQKTKNDIKDGVLFLLVIDMDNFKSINDIYGHTAGDKALVFSADILRQSFQKRDDFIARFGGDEFIVISSCKNTAQIPDIIKMVQAHVEAFNLSHKADFQLSMSIGAAVYNTASTATVDEWIRIADKEMYAVKARKHTVQAD